MDAIRFDALIRLLAHGRSRRRMLREFGREIAAAPLALIGFWQDAAACRNNGRRCKIGQQCCSGICAGSRKKNKAKCRPAEGARGRTIDDACGTPCPGSPSSFCARTLGGKPFCFAIGSCFDCDSTEECVDFTGNPRARCVRCPELCGAEDNFRQCVVADLA